MKSRYNRYYPSLPILIWILFAPPANAQGGNEVGNGGNAVVCKGKPTQMLDLYEASILRNTKVDEKFLEKNGKKPNDPFAIAGEKLDLLSKLDSKSGKALKAGLDKMKEDISFENEIKIKPIDDSLHGFTPSDSRCQIEQLAILRKHPLPGEKRILVDQNIWKEMPLTHQTALVLHEAIYEYLAVLGEKDSTKARYLVSEIMRPVFPSLTPDAYWAMIKKLRLPIYR